MGEGRQFIAVAASLDSLQTVRDFLKGRAAVCGLPGDAALDLITAVDEALTNIIVHGCRHDAACTIIVEARPGGGGLCVRLLDRAPPFDPTTYPPPDLDIPLHLRPPGGLGIFLMKQTVDTVTYRTRPGGGNMLSLCKWAEGTTNG